MNIPASFLALSISLVAGAAVPMQAGANATLGRGLGHPLWATLVSLAVSAVAGLLVLALLRAPAPELAVAAKGPVWTWLGGVLGVFYVSAALILAPRLGAGAFMAAVVAGQMLASLMLDRYGLFGFVARALTPGRLAGAVLVVAGAVVMQLASGAAAIKAA